MRFRLRDWTTDTVFGLFTLTFIITSVLVYLAERFSGAGWYILIGGYWVGYGALRYLVMKDFDKQYPIWVEIGYREFQEFSNRWE